MTTSYPSDPLSAGGAVNGSSYAPAPDPARGSPPPAARTGAPPAGRRKRSRKGKYATQTRLMSLAQLDGRTAAAQRARDLIADLEADLGGAEALSHGERQLVQHAGILGAMIENDAVALLQGGAVDVPNYLSSINAQRRILTTLGLSRRAKDVTSYADKVAAIRSQVPAEVLDNEETAE